MNKYKSIKFFSVFNRKLKLLGFGTEILGFEKTIVDKKFKFTRGILFHELKRVSKFSARVQEMF